MHFSFLNPFNYFCTKLQKISKYTCKHRSSTIFQLNPYPSISNKTSTCSTRSLFYSYPSNISYYKEHSTKWERILQFHIQFKSTTHFILKSFAKHNIIIKPNFLMKMFILFHSQQFQLSSSF